MAREIQNFLVLLRELQKIDPEFPLQYAVCLAEISLDEGLSLTNLSSRTGMPLSTVSRIIGALSRHRQKGAPYDLIHVIISPQERRKKQIYLTTRGKTVMNGISGILTAGDAQRLHA